MQGGSLLIACKLAQVLDRMGRVRSLLETSVCQPVDLYVNSYINAMYANPYIRAVYVNPYAYAVYVTPYVSTCMLICMFIRVG